MTVRQGLWDGRVTFTPPLLAAAILVTPGLGASRRWRALALGLAALVVVHLADVLVNLAYTGGASMLRDGAVVEPGRGFAGQLALNALSYFFDTMGPAFFTIVIYAALVVWLRASPGTDRPSRRIASGAGR